MGGASAAVGRLPSDMHLPDLSLLTLTKFGKDRFQAEFWQVMRRVQETNNWDELAQFIRAWHRTALLSLDPDYRQNLERLRGQPRERPENAITLEALQEQITGKLGDD